jgi:hypothetical protein
MVGFAASVRVKTRQKITANLRNNDTKYIIEVASKLKTMHGELFSRRLIQSSPLISFISIIVEVACMEDYGERNC